MNYGIKNIGPSCGGVLCSVIDGTSLIFDYLCIDGKMLPSYFCRYWENDKVRLDYRTVHMNTLDDNVESFPPKARVY